ncbi:hypothetical protein VP01_2797g3 [Puccinia sorghi]|uniref:Uncharacterized protein n=1 Tax=Puccinia sorghi TaxID=27349 RepID=A0A0L6V3B5_9BASI|nr:hypothetical protein VP01_2797g3 [Puccinia sorghi]
MLHVNCRQLRGVQGLIPDMGIGPWYDPQIRYCPGGWDRQKNIPTSSTSNNEEIDSKHNQPEAANILPKRSWVWNHLKEADEVGYLFCQFVFRSGKICGIKLKKEKSSSTNTKKKLSQLPAVDM